MRDLRPIALCTVIYKIIAKVLANRPKVVLPIIIAHSQSAFVLGRSIVDSVLVAFELIHFLKTRKKGSWGWAALKIDISKAYVRIDWGNLEKIMWKLGFSEQWIKMIMLRVTSVTFHVLVNGEEVCPIFPKRGLRQGDPLFPYLFILCAKVLSTLILKAEHSGQLHGCKISRSTPPISHLLFADDNFFLFSSLYIGSFNYEEYFENL